MSILAVPSRDSIQKGFIEVYEDIVGKLNSSIIRVVRVPVTDKTNILVIGMPINEEGRLANMYECIVDGTHGWVLENRWNAAHYPLFYRVKYNIQLYHVSQNNMLQKDQVSIIHLSCYAADN